MHPINIFQTSSRLLAATAETEAISATSDKLTEIINKEVDQASSVLQHIFEPVQNAIPDMLFAVVVLLIGLVVVKFLMRFVSHALSRSRLDGIMAGFLKSLLKILLYVLLFIIVLSILNVPMTSLITLVGSAGVAVGLALKDSLSNLAGGFIVLFSKPLKEGDTVEVDNCTGKVESISILYTKIVTPDNTTAYIPNGTVAAAKIINYTDKELRRVDFLFGVGYENDIDQVRQVILDTIAANEMVLTDPKPEILVSAHQESAIEFKVLVWAKSDQYWNVYYALMEEIKKAFDEHHISIPFPQVDVHYSIPERKEN